MLYVHQGQFNIVLVEIGSQKNNHSVFFFFVTSFIFNLVFYLTIRIGQTVFIFIGEPLKINQLTK